MITIYSKDDCAFCTRAIQLAKSKQLEHTVLKLGVDYTKEELLAKCPQPVRSLPQIFFDEEYVGGFVEMQRKLNTKE